VARGLALQALGHLSNIVRKQDDVHFRVLDRLTSSNQFESQSALFCISHLAAVSESFSAAVLRIAPGLLAEENAGSAFKIGLVSVLGEMRHSSLCGLAREHVMTFLSSHLNEDFVVAGLRALTRISDMQAENHVEFLWQQFLSDPRPRVRLMCLRGLFAMAARAPHHGDHRPALVVSFLRTPQPPAMQAALLAVFAMIARHWRANGRLSAVDTSSIAAMLGAGITDARVAVWALRALSGAAAVFAPSAEQLRAHVIAELKRPTTLQSQKKRSVLLEACVLLCSERVSQHSPDCPALVLKALLDAAASLNGDGSAAVLHALSMAVTRAPLRAAQAVLGEDRLSTLAFAHVASPMEFAAVVVTMIRLFVLFDGKGSAVVEYGKLASVLRQVEPLVTQSAEWRWWWYCVAREAAVCGMHGVSAPMFALLSMFPDSDACRSWLLFLSDMSEAERQAQKQQTTEAAVLARRALVSLGSVCNVVTQQSASVVSVQAFSRSNSMMLQRRFAKWRLGVFEAGIRRGDLWQALGLEAEALASAVVDMTNGCSLFLQDCASCCFAISGAAVLSRPDEKPQWISKLRSSLSSAPSSVGVLSAFYAASSLLPRDLFQTRVSVEVELSVGKLKVPTEMSELNIHNSNDTGHVVTIDGVVLKQGARGFKSVVLTVSVIWAPEKPSVTARMLCCEKRVGNVLSTQNFTGRVFNGSFSVQTLLTFSGQPKNQHVILLRVALEAETGKLFENVGLDCVAFSQLTQA
jgi:hypothetical protein